MITRPEPRDAITRPAVRSAHTSWIRGAGWLTLATVVLSGSNYAFSLSMARLLPAAQFVDYVGLQSVLLVIGTGVMAAVPWVMARELAQGATDGSLGSTASEQGGRPASLRAAEVFGFGLMAAVAQGMLVAVLAGGLAWHIGGPILAVIAAAAAFCLSMVAAPVGMLQGRQRFREIAVLRLTEGAVRVVLGLTLVVLLERSAPMAIAGMPIGSLVLVLLGVWLCRHSLPPTLVGVQHGVRLLRTALRLGSVQIMLTLVAATDTIVAASSGLSTGDGYAYQAAALLGRAPLFVAIALAQAIYPTLVRSSFSAAEGELRRALGLYVRVALVGVIALTTVPRSVLAVVADQRAAEVGDVLRITSVTGLFMGLITLLVVAHQARPEGRSTNVTLLAGLVGLPVGLLVASSSGAVAYAGAGAVLSVVLAVAVGVSVRTWQPVAWIDRGLLRFGALALLLGLIAVVAQSVVGWVVVCSVAAVALVHEIDPGLVPGSTEVKRHARRVVGCLTRRQGAPSDRDKT